MLGDSVLTNDRNAWKTATAKELLEMPSRSAHWRVKDAYDRTWALTRQHRSSWLAPTTSVSTYDSVRIIRLASIV